jgi:polysaccharide biosynthesis protein PslH
VDDVRPWYQRADVIAIPLRIGSGIKLKTLEALSMQVPVVSTSVGTEGIEMQPGQEALVADTPEKFADNLIMLLQDRTNAIEMVRKARQLVQTKYDWRIITSQFEHQLIEISNSRSRV